MGGLGDRERGGTCGIDRRRVGRPPRGFPGEPGEHRSLPPRVRRGAHVRDPGVRRGAHVSGTLLIADAVNLLGCVLRDTGNQEEGLPLLLRSLEIFERHEVKHEIGKVLYNLGTVHRASENWRRRSSTSSGI